VIPDPHAGPAHLWRTMPGQRRRGRLIASRSRLSEDVSAMARARYEVRVNGTLSERARSAFRALDVASVPAQTIVFGELAEVSDLGDLLALCSAMGLEVVSLRRLPCRPAAEPGTSAANGAAVPGGPARCAVPGTDPEGPMDRGAET
jgi:hypothetical protein